MNNPFDGLQVELRSVDPRCTPQYQTDGSAAVDLAANIKGKISLFPDTAPTLIPTGIFLNMSATPWLAAMILPRSGLGHRAGLVLGNLVGLIDSDYQGEVMVSAWNRGKEILEVKPYERFAQLVFVPVARVGFVHVEDFTRTTQRGTGGFGSTGGN